MNKLLIDLLSDIDDSEILFGLEADLVTSRDVSPKYATEWVKKYFPEIKVHNDVYATVLYVEWFRKALEFSNEIEKFKKSGIK